MAVLKIVRVSALMFLGEILGLTQGCPENWLQHGQSCYYKGNNRMTWAEADSYCRSLDSLLAVIDSAEEHELIADILPTFQFVWLGCKEEIEGEWVCLAGGDITKPMEYAEWGENSPENTRIPGCIKTYIKHNGDSDWFDTTCTGTNYPVCERKLIDTNTAVNKKTCRRSATLT